MLNKWFSKKKQAKEVEVVAPLTGRLVALERLFGKGNVTAGSDTIMQIVLK